MSVSVFIDGAAGTTGLEIRERLGARADLRLIEIDEARRKDPAARAEALNDADVAILCLPDDAAREAVALIRSDTKVIDASSAHRVTEGWTYGFPELGFDVAAARLVTNPGCYPTGFLALVAPLVFAGLLHPNEAVVVIGTSGYSGGGKSMIAEYEAGDPSAHRAYALGLAHKHLPEMIRYSGLTHLPIFLPAVANTYRGMLIELPLDLGGTIERPSLGAVRDTLRQWYADCPLVTVADGELSELSIEEHAGTDRMTLRVFGNEKTGHARLIATLDNLGKGAAGAAVQNLNLMAGLDPLAGLIP